MTSTARPPAAHPGGGEQAVNNYQAQIEQTNKDTDELARQAYVAKMLGQKNLDQQLSAAGYAGGMADSQRIQTETNYENNLQDIENQRLEVVAELERPSGCPADRRPAGGPGAAGLFAVHAVQLDELCAKSAGAAKL